MKPKRSKTPSVGGLYNMNQPVKTDRSATQHAIKNVIVSAVLIVIVFFGYRVVSGQGLNPFQSQPNHVANEPKSAQSSSSSQSSTEPAPKLTNLKKAVVLMGNIYSGMNHIANGYGDTNRDHQPLVAYFVNGKSNPGYTYNYKWANLELGNYHTQGVQLTPTAFTLHGNELKYKVLRDYKMADGSHMKSTNQWVAKLQFKSNKAVVVTMSSQTAQASQAD